ncbi:MAG: SNF2-related protein [Candidatus Nanopelagicales bacterium]
MLWAEIDQATVCLSGPRSELTQVLPASHYPTLHRGAKSDPRAEQRVRLHTAAGVAPGLARLTGGDEAVSDSVLALTALVAEGRRIALAGNIRLGARDGRLVWEAAPTAEDQRRASAAAEQVVIAAGDDQKLRDTAIEMGARFAVSAADELAATLPLPAAIRTRPDLQELASDDGYRLWLWHRRAALRRSAQGARVVILLDPDDPEGLTWIASVSLAEGLCDAVHPVRDRHDRPRLPGVDPDVAAELLSAEIEAARRESRAPGLFTSMRAHLHDRSLVKFLNSIEDLAAAGIEVRAPKGLRRAAGRLRTAVSVSGAPGGMAGQDLQLDVVVDLDGRRLSQAEVGALATAHAPFVRLGSEWIPIPQGAEAAARLLQRAGRGALAPVDLLDDDFVGIDIDAVDVSGWVGTALRGEAQLSTLPPVEPPAGLHADLRHYQRDGLAWLTWCEANGVGGILADDMGLGKTVQLLSRIATDHSGPTLVVCPTTLLENWRREAAKFTPDLTVAVHHGTNRDIAHNLAGTDLLITTYGLLTRDRALREVAWHRVILDEAQAIKNPAAKASQAARKLTADHRFAVTGTPVENHLGDLWSLMAFTQPGLLGSFASFRRRYLSVSGREDEERLARLRAVVSPFLLRRSKRDKSVVPDLPDKIELRRDCALTKEQVGIYEAVVKRLEAETSAATGTRRRGLILAGLTKLKQACVHPQLALGTHRAGLDRTSGKVEELIAIVEEAVDEGDAVLVFSQYATFLAPLGTLLASRGLTPPLRLDGSMPPERRAGVVDAFSDPEGPPVLLASLKAGGTGLNLVRANHVIHLDRWWNPAVEDQGSDRAWRLGQTSNVMVHTLVCPGTVEDRIAEVLDTKRATADSIVGAEPGAAVTEMSDDDLHELITLVRDEQILLRGS